MWFPRSWEGLRKLFSVCGKSEGGGNIFLNFSRVVDFRLVFKCDFENIPIRNLIQYLNFFTNLGIPEYGKTSQWHIWIVIDIQVNLREENNPWCGTRLESRWGTFWLVPPREMRCKSSGGIMDFTYVISPEVRCNACPGEVQCYTYILISDSKCADISKEIRVYQLFSVKNVYHGTDGWDIPTVGKSILQFSSI